MKVIIATPILFDKTSPFNHLFKDILEGFIGSGYQIIRLVATESHDDHSYDFDFSSENIEYIPFLRKKTEKSNIIVRYLSDSWINIKMARKIRKLKDSSILFEDVSYSSFWTVRAAKKKGIRVVAMLQDVWPDNAVQSGLIREGSLIYKFFEVWQRYVYKRADKLICISEDMKNFIVNKGVPAEKIEVIYNWGYEDEPVNIAWEDNGFVKKYNLDPKKFYAVYAGNIGRMQNVHLIVEAAKLLKENENIHFLIVGEGVMREKIEQMTKGMDNVTMLPLQPQELAVSIYSMAGVNIIPLVPGGLKTALPSKIGVCLSCGNPIIACVDSGSQLEEMFLKYDCGEIAKPTDASDLANKIVSVSQREKNKNYTCFRNNFVRSYNVLDYVNCIGDVK